MHLEDCSVLMPTHNVAKASWSMCLFEHLEELERKWCFAIIIHIFRIHALESIFTIS